MFKRIIQRALKTFDLTLVKDYDGDLDDEFRVLNAELQPYTMTSPIRLYALYEAVYHVVKHKIPGDFVECGVWRGGGSMLAAKTFHKAGDTGRKLYLYDTYRGMSEPAEVDVSRRGEDAREEWKKARKGEINTWCYSSIEEVRKNMHSTGYPPEKVVFVEGEVEETIPGIIPEEISILRLDTDWCQSTYHELVHLYPRLAVNGILFVDDYGMWQGARKAVDRYLQEQGKPVYLHRIDHSARLAVKPG
jgi:hypothetical protein